MAETLRVAAVQMNSGEDKERNVETALRLVEQAAREGAELVVLPEYTVYLGRRGGYEANAEAVPGPTAERFEQAARAGGVWLLAGSLLERSWVEGRYYNTSLLFDPRGRLVARYRKVHLFDVDLGPDQLAYRESATILPGEEILTAALDGHRLGLSICYDLRFPELYRQLALDGAEVVVVPAAFTAKTGRDHWELLLRARAVENGVFVVAAAQFGASPPSQAWFGHSMVVDPWGTVVARAPGDGEAVLHATLDFERLRAVRQMVPSLANRRPAAYERPAPVGR
jgi:deaminated glutathione amidase